MLEPIPAIPTLGEGRAHPGQVALQYSQKTHFSAVNGEVKSYHIQHVQLDVVHVGMHDNIVMTSASACQV